MKRIFLLFLAFVLVFAFAGCAKRTVTTPVEQEAPKENSSKAAPVEQKKAEEPVMAKAEPKKVETVPVKEVTEAKSSQFGNILLILTNTL